MVTLHSMPQYLIIDMTLPLFTCTVLYLQSNPGGVTIFGWAVDRALINSIFFIELSLVLFVLGKTIVLAKWSLTSLLVSADEKSRSHFFWIFCLNCTASAFHDMWTGGFLHPGSLMFFSGKAEMSTQVKPSLAVTTVISLPLCQVNPLSYTQNTNV